MKTRAAPTEKLLFTAGECRYRNTTNKRYSIEQGLHNWKIISFIEPKVSRTPSELITCTNFHMFPL